MKTNIRSSELLIEEHHLLKEQYLLLKQKEKHLQVINDFATSLLVQNTVEEIVWDIAKNTIARLGYVDCVVYLIDEASEYLIQKAAHGPKNPVDLDIYNPIKIKIGEGIVGYVAKTGIPELIKDTREDDRYIQDDDTRLAEIAIPIITDDNRVIGVIDSEHPQKGFFTIYDQKILTTIASIAASKLLQAKAQMNLKASNKDLEQFVYIASHDLKEPLRMIVSYAQLLKRFHKKDLNTQGLEFLEYMVEGATRMNTLIQDLLVYSQTDKVNIKANYNEIDCNEVLEVVRKNLQFSIEETKAVIYTEQPLPIVKGQFSQIVQLFQNLISNAIKFRYQDVIPIIKIKVQEVYPNYIFSIKDNGIGIHPDFQHKIFSVFKRLHNRSQYEGTGVGLAICKKTVEKMGGQLWVESEEGKGATFFFTLPT